MPHGVMKLFDGFIAKAAGKTCGGGKLFGRPPLKFALAPRFSG